MKQIKTIPFFYIKKIIKEALFEDMALNIDITSILINNNILTAKLITYNDMIFCGYDLVNEIARQVDSDIKIKWFFYDGDYVEKNTIVCEITGRAYSILTSERTILNFIQLLSAISTKTNRYVDIIKHTKAKILDTRKTIPGLRIAEKYAVYCGNGVNHRINLFDTILIKNNHIKACNLSITNLIKTSRMLFKNKIIEIEVINFFQLKEAIKNNVDIIMLDNFILKDIKKAVTLISNKAKIEVSGNVSLKNVVEIAETGIDYISIGDLTKNIKAIDLSMRFI